MEKTESAQVDVSREQQLDDLLREARFWIWSYEVPSARMAADRDDFLERVSRVLNVQGRTLKVPR